MPQVPTLNSQISPQAAPNIQRRPLQSTAAQSLGAGIFNIGAAAHKVREEEQQKADRAAVIEAKTLLGEAENALLYDPANGALAKQGKDAFNLPGQVLPEFDKSASKITQSLKNDRQKRFFSEMLAESRSQIMRDLNRHEFTQRENYYDQSDEALVASTIQTAARNAASPERIAAQVQTQRAVIDGMAKRKGWDATQTQRAQFQAESKLHEAVVGNFLVKDAHSGARSYLAENAARMDDATVEQLQRRLAIEEDGLIRRQELQQRKLSDAAAKDGDRLIAQGALTSGWIEQHRNELDGADYRYFYQKLKGGDGSGPSDPILYADLRDRAGRGEDVRTEAREALRRGQIGTSDYDRVLGEVEGERPGWYKRGKEFISTSAAVSDLNPDPAAAQRKAAMINDWDEWAQANPKATDSDARSAAERLVQEYAIVDTSKIALVKRAPQFLVGGRRAPDLDATIVATVKAYEDGQIDRSEFERQAALIKEWEEVMRLAPKPKAKTDGR